MFIKNCMYMIARVTLVAVLIMGIFSVQPAKAGAIEFGSAQSLGGTGFNYGTAIALDTSGNVYATGFQNYTNIPLSKLDDNGNFIWSKLIACPSGCRAQKITTDSNGNVYIAGNFWATVDFDPGEGTRNLTSAGSADAFVSKFDRNGNFLWAKSIGGTGDDAGNGVGVDENGNVYLTGNYSGTVDFDPGEGISVLTSPGLYYDVFISKFDGNGNFIWAKGIGGMSDDESFDIAVDGNRSIFVTGMFSLTADFDPGVGNSTLTSTGGNNLFVTKLDSNGNFVWANSGGEATLGAGIEMALDGSGNIYVAGYRSTGLSDYFDVAVSKLDGNGNFLWIKNMGGTSPDAGYGIAVDANGSVYTTGEFGGTVDFDPGAETSNLTSAGDNDIFISKLDTNGNFLWAQSLGGISSDTGDGIAVDRNGNLYLTGYYSDTVDFDPGVGINNLTSVEGSRDIFITKLSRTPQIYYVKWNATGANDGTSWANAYTDLQSALSAASNSDEIWVAAGTYKPGNDRTSTFILKDGVAIYGGFAGTEASLNQRDPSVNVTILSGDLNGDDNSNILPDEPTRAENVLHVVSSSGVSNTTILDGFTIKSGNANLGAYNTPTAYGGGMWNGDGEPILTNLIYADNSALYLGGGMFVTNSNSTLTNVTFDKNYSAVYGGGLAIYPGNPILTNAKFINNTAAESGGGTVNLNGSRPIFTDVTFSGNTAALHGGGMANYSSHPTISKSTFYDNHATYRTDGGGGGIYNESSNPVIENTTFSGNTAEGAGSGIANEQSNPIITNVTFTNNWDAIWNLSLSHPVIRNSIVWGNIYPGTGGVYTIHDGYNSSSIISDSVIQSGFPGGTNIITTDPLLGTLGNYGGKTLTIPLLTGSSAIDQGNTLYCPATDQRGVTRPQGIHCDIGAYEVVELDTTPPTALSIVRTDGNPTSALSTDFTVTFSEPVTEVDTNDFTLKNATGMITGATVNNVTGMGAVRTVTVNTGAGNGTLGLEVPVGATISDLAGNPMGGLPFTSGEFYTILKTSTFSDVESTYWAWNFIERLYLAGITGGCALNPPQYCPETVVTRAQMAVFLERSIHSSSYYPPAVGSSTGFGDVSPTYWAGAWIKQLAADGITGGCGSGNYCPEAPVTRAQMAVFLLHSKYGASYSPPAVGSSTGFGDVSSTYWVGAWIKQLVIEGITAGCGSGSYCPEAPVTRAQMAVFLVRTFNLP